MQLSFVQGRKLVWRIVDMRLVTAYWALRKVVSSRGGCRIIMVEFWWAGKLVITYRRKGEKKDYVINLMNMQKRGRTGRHRTRWSVVNVRKAPEERSGLKRRRADSTGIQMRKAGTNTKKRKRGSQPCNHRGRRKKEDTINPKWAEL